MQAVATRRVTRREEFICKCREGCAEIERSGVERCGGVDIRLGERSIANGRLRTGG